MCGDGNDRPGLQPSQMRFVYRDPGRWPGLVWRRTFGAWFRCNLELNAGGIGVPQGLSAGEAQFFLRPLRPELKSRALIQSMRAVNPRESRAISQIWFYS